MRQAQSKFNTSGSWVLLMTERWLWNKEIDCDRIAMPVGCEVTEIGGCLPTLGRGLLITETKRREWTVKRTQAEKAGLSRFTGGRIDWSEVLNMREQVSIAEEQKVNKCKIWIKFAGFGGFGVRRWMSLRRRWLWGREGGG